MGRHAKSRSLASRKREKNMSGALLENAYRVDTKDVVPFKASWDTQVPRKMRQMMHAVQLVQQGASAERRPRHIEDTGERRPSKKQRQQAQQQAQAQQAEAGAASGSERGGAQHGPAPKPPAKKKRRRQEEGGGEAANERGPPQEPHAPVKPRKPKAEVAARLPRFGETNAAPPELQIKGVLARKSPHKTAAADALAWQREAVLESYRAAKQRRGGGDGGFDAAVGAARIAG